MNQGLNLMTALALPMSADDSGCPTGAFMDRDQGGGRG